MEASTATLKQKQRDLDGLLKELEIGEAEMRHGPITQARGDELQAKAEEAEEIQGFLDRYNKIAGVRQAGRELQRRTMPLEKEEKSRPKIVRTTPGHLFVMSDSFGKWRAASEQSGWSAKVDVKDLRNGTARLYGDDAEKFEVKVFDAATLQDLGTDALIPEQRDPELVRFEEVEMLTIRNVLSTLPATSDSIKFVRHSATTRGAAGVERAAEKPYLTTAYETASVVVETIAVLAKVTEQDIEDAPRLVGIINGEMRLDIRVEEERQLLHGSGASGEIEGLYSQGIEGTYEFARAEAGDTLIDTIRKMRTDLRKRRVNPNAVLIDPLDWEDIELQKATDDHYIWGLISDLRGPRIWSLRVVESDAMTHPDTNERRVLMGDFVRGATLYDRHDVRMAVGFVDDDFRRNLRTLRAEERLALAVKRAWAFEYVVTDAGS